MSLSKVLFFSFSSRTWHVGRMKSKSSQSQSSIYKIDNRDLLYSTGNSTQYSVMAYTGKESKKRVDICICITDSLCCTPETNKTL